MVGIDSSATLIDLARCRLADRQNVRLYVSDIADVSSYGEFDALLCLDVIEHIDDDLGALKLLRGACRLGGKLILTVPALGKLYGMRDHALGHYRRYNKVELLAKLSVAGLAVRTCQYWNMAGVPAYWLSERILSRPVNDALRTGSDSGVKSLIRSCLRRWLKIEAKCPFLPLGLSLVCVASRS